LILRVRTNIPRELTIPTKTLMIAPYGRQSHTRLIE
jgi:hypothetical protein